MNIELYKNYIDNCSKESLDLVSNQILYDMCSKYPTHTDKREIYAKTIIIGRTYAVALERDNSKSKSDKTQYINDDFYEKVVIGKIINSRFDDSLENIRNQSYIVRSNISCILDVYRKLIEITDQFERGQKRSFCSKYLHFHFPNLFFIIDSRAEKSLSRFEIKIPNEYKMAFSHYIDMPYAKFFIKCFLLQQEIINRYNKKLSPRELDSIFLKMENDKLRN